MVKRSMKPRGCVVICPETEGRPAVDVWREVETVAKKVKSQWGRSRIEEEEGKRGRGDIRVVVPLPGREHRQYVSHVKQERASIDSLDIGDTMITETCSIPRRPTETREGIPRRPRLRPTIVTSLLHDRILPFRGESFMSESHVPPDRVIITELFEARRFTSDDCGMRDVDE